MDMLNDQNDSPPSDCQPNKRRRKKSMVWDHFTIETINAECIRASCNQCKKSFAYISGSKLAGTSHLKRHIALGICPVSKTNHEKNQLVPYSAGSRNNISINGAHRPRKSMRAANAAASIYFDGDHCSLEFAKMVIQHDYPLHMAGHSGFVNFAQALHPEFNATSLNAVEEQIMGIYLREKQKLMAIINGIPGRLSLSMDLWTSYQNQTYIPDHDWKLQRRIFNFMGMPNPDSDAAFNHAVEACLTDWSSEGKLLTLSLDRSHANENGRRNLRGLLSIKNSLILNGQLLINSCYGRILSSLAKDALEFVRGTVEKVRHSVKYVKTSDAHEERFTKLKQKLQVPSTKNLMIDDLTKWNTTYHMLMAASELKEVFSCLDTADPDYKVSPSMEEWRQVEILCTYLKIFYEAASILTSPVYPTTNMFFHDAWKVHFELLQATSSHDVFVSNLTRPLLEKISKYWEDCNLILAVAAVMDPRFKLKFVEFGFNRIYGHNSETWIKIVDEGLHELYLEYVVQSLPPLTFLEEGNDCLVKTEMLQDDSLLGNDSLLSNGDGYSEFDIYISDISKSEVDQYLEEPLLPRVQDFDVLGWWKAQSSNYPTLSKMASDVLSIPLSTLSMDSVFDTSDRKVDVHRSSLRPATLQALVCAKDWLHYGFSEKPSRVPTGIPTAIVKIESL